ncbi:MAG: PmbA/TldA family metallopeptidase, partial [Synechococcales cyanobacterium]
MTSSCFMTSALKIQDLAIQAKTIAARLHILKFDIFGSIIDETSIEVDHGEPKQVEASNRFGVTVRVWNENGTVGVTSTTDLHPQGLELALKTAY